MIGPALGVEVCYPARPPVPQPAPFPDLSPDLYPILAGPPAWYPAEPKVRPVWPGGGPVYVPADPLDENAEPEDHLPVITSRETYRTWDYAWYPSGPRGFLRRAEAAGWDVRMGFSRGYIPGAKADTWDMRDMIGVWVNGYGRRAAAFWSRNPDAEFSARKLEAGNIKPGEIPSGMTWKASGTTIRISERESWTYASLADLDEWVALHGAVLPSWYKVRSDWVQAHEMHSAFKARERAKALARANEKAAQAR